MKIVLASLSLAFVLTAASTVYGEDAKVIQITDGKAVKLNYTLSVDGKVVDSSDGAEPLQYVHGQKQLIPGLERQLEGMKVGDEKEADIKPEDAYGDINPKAYAEIPREKLPPGDLKVGMQLHTTGQDGQPVFATISKVKKDSVVMDFNHPLAGKKLHFKVKIVSIA